MNMLHLTESEINSLLKANFILVLRFALWKCLCLCCIVIYMQNKHNNTTMKKDERHFFKKIYLSLFLKGLCVRGSLRPNRTATYWPPLLWSSALCLFRSQGLLNRRPGGPLCWVQLSLPHLVTNGSDLQTQSGFPKGPFCWVVTFSTTSCLYPIWSPTNWLSVSTKLYNCWIAHSIFGMACLIVIKRK